MGRTSQVGWMAALLLSQFCCGPAPSRHRSEPPSAVARAEDAFQMYLDLRDRLAVATARGVEVDEEGLPVSELAGRLSEAKKRTLALLKEAEAAQGQEDGLAVQVMKEILARSDPAEAPAESPLSERPPCDFSHWESLAGEAGLRRLEADLYRCFGHTNENLKLDGEAVDRLTLLGRLSVSRDAADRRRAFDALRPLWRAVNGDNTPDSPYRKLIRLAAEDLRRRRTSVQAEAAGPLGLRPEAIEEWLVAILEQWGELVPTEIEPWDVWSQGADAEVRLRAGIPLESLRTVNDRFYRSLGADPSALGLLYDLSPRPGKTPVAFTDFGRRNRIREGRWEQGRFWIFATYRTGGLGNLFELLHETGHGVHIASIRTRPAFQDWPDSDVFTEGLADLAALEVYEPEWQREYLGESVPWEVSVRSKYASIALDAAWGLFELRLLGDPTLDPNQVWTEITGRYLKVRPHPELSWWALRGQLVESPGYMLNYGIGAVLIADVRAKARESWGPFRDNPEWLGHAAKDLYRFGREKSSGQVLRDFLGREPTPAAILADMGR